MNYTLTMNSVQAREINKAVELLLRLKIGQYEQIPWAILGGEHPEEFCRKRDTAKPYLQAAFGAMSDDGIGNWKKDDEWHVLYDLHQVIRKAIHDAEYPETKGVDSYPVMHTGCEALARMEESE